MIGAIFMEDDNITVFLAPFLPYPEGNILAILNALGRPVVISVAKHLPEERRTELVEDLKAFWQTMLALKENDLIQIIVRDPRSKHDIETGDFGF
jgi:hypothetical protein